MKYFILLFSSTLLISGCHSNVDKVRDTILSYTNFVSKMYSEKDYKQADSVIDSKQIGLIKQRVESFDTMSIRLHPSLRSIRIDKVTKMSEKEVEVATGESWDFAYFSINTGRELQKKSMDFSMHYILVHVNKKWLVREVAVQSVETGKSKMIDPFAELPQAIIPAWSSLETDELLKNSVIAYLNLLAAGYKKQDMASLFHSATKRRALKTYHHMSSMGEGEVRMEPRLLEIEIPEVSLVSDDSALAKTTEQWIYTYYSTGTGDKVYENHVSYTLTYELIKDSGNRWLVDEITIDQMEQGEGKGELPFFSRPHENSEGKKK